MNLSGLVHFAFEPGRYYCDLADALPNEIAEIRQWFKENYRKGYTIKPHEWDGSYDIEIRDKAMAAMFVLRFGVEYIEFSMEDC